MAMVSPNVKDWVWKNLINNYKNATKDEKPNYDIAQKRVMDAVISYMFRPQQKIVDGYRAGKDIKELYQQHLEFMREFAQQNKEDQYSAYEVFGLVRSLRKKLQELRVYAKKNKSKLDEEIAETNAEPVPEEFEIIIGGSFPWGTARVRSSDLDALYNHYLIRNFVRLTSEENLQVLSRNNINLNLSHDVDFNLSQLARRTSLLLKITEHGTYLVIYSLPKPTNYTLFKKPLAPDTFVHSDVQYLEKPIEIPIDL